MELASSYDFVALRSVHGYPPAELDNRNEVETLGQPCSGAGDSAACRGALADAWPAPEGDWRECGQGGCATFGVVTTRGDTVQMHDQLPELMAVLGEIDTPVEALFWADANGYQPRCTADALFQLSAAELVEVQGGYRLRNYEMIADCPIQYQGVVLDIARDGRLNEAERFAAPPTQFSACVGRRPPGLVAGPPRGEQRAEVGHFFASVAALEAAAVTAFHVIAAELEAFGAPEELRAQARAAAIDEERHWAIASALSAEWGVTSARPRIEPRPLRALFDFALDNVVEGCVREAFGAAVAKYQAAAAADPRVRELLAAIAEDERRHAELSFSLQAWLEPLLDAGELARLQGAARSAISELRAEHRASPAPSVRRTAGMPDARAAARLIDALEAALWSPVLRAA